ncbi:MAG: hypothetical protein ACK4JB_20030 [Reyranella sp.]
MSAPIPQNCTWVGGVSPADAPDTVEAVNARIRWHLDQVGQLRLRRTSLRRAAIRAAAKGVQTVEVARGLAQPVVA